MSAFASSIPYTVTQGHVTRLPPPLRVFCIAPDSVKPDLLLWVPAEVVVPLIGVPGLVGAVGTPLLAHLATLGHTHIALVVHAFGLEVLAASFTRRTY